MRTALASLTALLFLANIATARPTPTGPPPVFKVVSGTNETKSLIEFVEVTYKYIPVQKEVAKEVVVLENGMQIKKIVKEVVSQYVPVMEERRVAIDAAKSRVITQDGKQLPIEEVWKRLKKDTVVLVSSDGKTPAQAYLRALNAETLVVMSPQLVRLVVPPEPPRIVEPNLPPSPKN